MKVKKKILLVLFITIVIITLIGMGFNSTVTAYQTPIQKGPGKTVNAGWKTLKTYSNWWCIQHNGALNTSSSAQTFTVNDIKTISSNSTNITEIKLAYILGQSNAKNGTTDCTNPQKALWTLIYNEKNDVAALLGINSNKLNGYNYENNCGGIYTNACNFANNASRNKVYKGKVTALTCSGKQTLLYGHTNKKDIDLPNPPPTTNTEKCKVSIQKYITKVYESKDAYMDAFYDNGRNDDGEMANGLNTTRRGMKVSDAFDDDDYKDKIVDTNIDKFNGRGSGNYGNCALKTNAWNKDENPEKIKKRKCSIIQN